MNQDQNLGRASTRHHISVDDDTSIGEPEVNPRLWCPKAGQLVEVGSVGYTCQTSSCLIRHHSCNIDATICMRAPYNLLYFIYDSSASIKACSGLNELRRKLKHGTDYFPFSNVNKKFRIHFLTFFLFVNLFSLTIKPITLVSQPQIKSTSRPPILAHKEKINLSVSTQIHEIAKLEVWIIFTISCIKKN